MHIQHCRSQATPLVLLHGIGVGLLSYQWLLRTISHACVAGRREAFLVCMAIYFVIFACNRSLMEGLSALFLRV
jgi:hypothetical protein